MSGRSQGDVREMKKNKQTNKQKIKKRIIKKQREREREREKEIKKYIFLNRSKNVKTKIKKHTSQNI